MPTLLTLLLVLLPFQSPHAPELPLNLVSVPPPPERAGQVGECGWATAEWGDSARAPRPFTVTLADTDRLAYAPGDTVYFTILLENTSAAPLVLGISRDPDVAPKTVRPCRVVPPGVHFRVWLDGTVGNGPTRTFASGVGYYGSPDAPGTTVVLQPGEAARIRLAAKIGAFAAELPTVRINALVEIERERAQLEESRNSLEIQLNARARDVQQP